MAGSNISPTLKNSDAPAMPKGSVNNGTTRSTTTPNAKPLGPRCA